MKHIFFMRQACKMCDFSSCGYKIGCVVVINGKAIAKSFNETLKGEIYCQNGECYREKHNLRGGKDIEKVCSIHAEANLIAKAASQGLSLKGADLYVTTFPCLVCSRSMVAAGFSRVFYMSDYGGNEALPLLESNNIRVTRILEEKVWGS
ncbi:MAG: deaminase [bacterium]